MRAVETPFDGVVLLAPQGLRFPHPTFEGFPSCCGAGQGWPEKIVPEQIGKTPVGPACYIHDVDWAYEPKTWAAFHALNSRFLHNLMVIVNADQSGLRKIISYYRCMTYYNAVDTIGSRYYFK